MRIRLKYADVQTFVEKFAPNVSRQGIFIASRTPKPVGTALRFELLLSDGKSRLLKGEGVVTWVREFDDKNPTRPHGMGVRFSRLDAESRRLLERIEQFKQERGARPEEARSEAAEAVASAPAVESAAVVPVSEAMPPVEATAEHEPAPLPDPLVAAAASPPPPDVPPQPERPRPASHVVPEPRFVVRSDDALDVDALLGVDGGALDQRLDRARAIARALAADGLGELDDLFGGAGLAGFLAAAREGAQRAAAELAPPRPTRHYDPPPPAPVVVTPEPSAVPDLVALARTEPVAAPEPDIASAADTEPEPARAPEPEPAPAPAPVRAAVPEPEPLPPPPAPVAIPRAEPDDKTIDFDFNFEIDLDSVDRPLPQPPPSATPPPTILGKPPAPSPPSSTSKALGTQPPRPRAVPPPPPPPAFRTSPIGPAPRAAAAQAAGEAPSIRVVPATPSVEVNLEDAATIDAALDSAMQLEDTQVGQTPPEPKATEKKGFFSKLFKK